MYECGNGHAHVCPYVYMHVYVSAYARVYVHVYLYVCVCVFMCMCQRACTCVRVFGPRPVDYRYSQESPDLPSGAAHRLQGRPILELLDHVQHAAVGPEA